MLAPLFRASVGIFDALAPARPMVADTFIKRAQRITGLDDFGDPAYAEGLERWCESLREDLSLRASGSLALSDVITTALVTRLRLRATPGPEETGTPPLIVVGLPRSGTTYLHRLLSLAPDARALPYWELREPIPGPGADRRRAVAQRNVSRLHMLRPEVRAKHGFGADEPEECVMLHDSSLWAPTAWRLAPVYRYTEWLLESDPTEGYREYARHVRRFAAQDPSKRLTLKNPDHTGFVRWLAESLPGVRIVQTHRDPMAVIPSYNSLMASVHSTTTKEPDLARSAQMSLRWWGEAVDRNVAQRDHVDIYDLRYDALVADPVGSVRAIHEHFGLPFDEGYRATLEEAVAARPQHQHGKHRYNLETFALSEEQIRARFAEYARRFLS